MNRSLLLGCALIALSSFALGCSEGVGSCDDPIEARDTVLVGNGSVQFAGQAILNQTCANGVCHASSVKGAGRNGAPAGLDFDLKPAKSSGEDENAAGLTIGKVDEDALAGLRKRQRKVVELRDSIWHQVKNDLMPPGDAFAKLAELTRVFDSDEQDVCTRASDDSFAPITDSRSKDTLRNWLACGAPIVETNTELVDRRVAGTVGYQYPQCGLAAEPTLEGVQASIFDDKCAGCHPGTNDLDLSSADATYASLFEGDDDACDGKPFITPGDVEASYLYDLVAKDEPGCHERMPYGGDPLSEDELSLIREWIEAGAPREGEAP